MQTNIELKRARGVTITGNTFWQGYKHNLFCENCTQLVIGSNMMERNPLYGYTSEANNTVVFQNCSDSTINALHLHHTMGGEAGMLVKNCRRINITGCTILDCSPVGLMLVGVRESSVTNCLIRDDRTPEPAGRAVALSDTEGRENMIFGNRLVGGLNVKSLLPQLQGNVIE